VAFLLPSKELLQSVYFALQLLLVDVLLFFDILEDQLCVRFSESFEDDFLNIIQASFFCSKILFNTLDLFQSLENTVFFNFLANAFLLLLQFADFVFDNIL